MFPQCAAIIRAQAIPPARIAHHSRIEREDLGLRDDLAPALARERRDDVHAVGDLVDIQPVHDRGATDFRLLGQSRHIQQAATLAHQQLEHAKESAAFLHTEQFLHIAREIGIEPLGEELVAEARVQQDLRQSSESKAVGDVSDTKCVQFLGEDRDHLNDTLPTGEGVAELLRCGQSGGARRQDTQLGEFVGRDLEQPTRIGKLMDFVEDDACGPHRSVEGFRIAQTFGGAGQVAVQECGVVNAAGENRLADAPGSCKPCDRRLFPGRGEAGIPEWAGYHICILHLDV